MPSVTELSRSLKGSRVLVTGAASGMGRATAAVFASEGARVAVTDYDLAGAEAMADEINQAGFSARAWKMDVSNKDDINTVTADISDHLGGLDVVINNAGISAFSAIDSDDYDQVWERALSVLVTGHQRLVRAALPHLRQSDNPRIVNIASTEALGATAENSPYAAAKAGVTGLTRTLAVELGPEGITVNCICPGPIDTAMTEFVPPDHKVIFAKRRTALRRYGSPEEVAHITVSLCLPASSYLTGAVIPVDGGLMARNA
ncbi:SDR family oxidoreductase [Alcanivorax sp. ZXX171]|nr:SDR family oxidoreductase [Alcanivorax sp. ZXX171]